VLVTIVSIQRTDAQKQAWYKAMAEELKRQCDIDLRDVMISLVTNSKWDWSFGLGEAQFLTASCSRALKHSPADVVYERHHVHNRLIAGP
jgi:hypothetical protein